MIFSIQAVLGATLLYAGWMTLDRHFTAGVVMCLLGVLCSVRPVLQVGGDGATKCGLLPRKPREKSDRPNHRDPTASLSGQAREETSHNPLIGWFEITE